jgi:hypothetical protein
MNLAIVLGGLTILVGLAVLIGHLDGRARDAARRRIATARGDVQEGTLPFLRQPGVRHRDRRTHRPAGPGGRSGSPRAWTDR